MNRALLVGINCYPSAPLRGCVNDVQDMARFLVDHCGYREHDIRLVVDERATAEAIRERLSWLVAGAKAGDRLLFHYSGHGVQMAPRNARGKIATLHDAICPVDFDFSMARALTDADFRRLFAKVPEGVFFNWISDSCHSGDLAREFGAGAARVHPMPADLAWHITTARKDGLETAGFHKALEHLHGALISGCRSDQTSADGVFGKRPNGALTHFLLKVLRGRKGLAEPLKGVVEATATLLKQNDFKQHPQLRGCPVVLGRPFLGGRTTLR